jgi:predicted enzyme related to lactoylglutathione lyase
MSETQRTHFEHANPILRVEDMVRAVRYYVEALGFIAAEWGDDDFTCVTRDGASIYLARGTQGLTGSWAWVGVADVDALYKELTATGAIIHGQPRNYPWALEIHVEDPDGNVLRMGSDPKEDQPYDDWQS